MLQFGTGGLKSSSVSSILDRSAIGIGSTNAASETAISTFVVPGLPGTTVSLPLHLEISDGQFLFTFGVYDTSAVTADPITQRQEYARQAIQQSVDAGWVVFSENSNPPGLGDKSITVAAGTELGFYIIPNNSQTTFLADPSLFYNGTANPNTAPNRFAKYSPLFSVSNANPGERDQMLSFVGNGKTVLLFDDIPTTLVGSDKDFNDLVFSINTPLTVTDRLQPQALGDINRDGFDDVAVRNGNRLQIVYGNANAAAINFAQPNVTITGFSGQELIATSGDFNGDGQPDLAVLDTSTDRVSLFTSIASRGTSFARTTANIVLTGASLPVSSTGFELAVTDSRVSSTPITLLATATGRRELSSADIAGTTLTFEIEVTGQRATTITTGNTQRTTLSTVKLSDTIQIQTTALETLGSLATAINFALAESPLAGASVTAVVSNTNNGRLSFTASLNGVNLQLLVRATPLRNFSSLSQTPNLNLNGDVASDLVITAGSAEGSLAGALDSAGRIYAVYGRTIPPAVFDELSNDSVAGFGAFVTDRGSGQPNLFDNGGAAFTFAAGQTERWFRFRTLGDGKANNAIRLQGNVIADLISADGDVLALKQRAIDLRTLEAGTYFLRVYAGGNVDYGSPIPLGNLFDDANNMSLTAAIATDTFKATADASDLGVNKVLTGGSATRDLDQAGQVSFNLSNLGWQSNQYSDPVNDANASPSNERPIRTTGSSNGLPTFQKIEDGVGLHANGLVTFDLNELRTAGGFAASQPFRFVADRVGMNDLGGGSIRTAVIVSNAQGVLSGVVNGQSVAVTNTSGTWSFSGTIPAAQTSSSGLVSLNIDLPSTARYLTLLVTGAGDGIGSDHGVFSGARLIPVDFRIEFAAPIPGQTHETSTFPDSDTIRGGDGDDLITGNARNDSIYGESGVDQFTAEPAEVRDFQTGIDRPLIAPTSGDAVAGNPDPILDPVIEIVDPGLSAMLATLLGEPTITTERGLDFDGSNDRVIVSNFGQVAPTTEITIEFWQKVDSVKAQSTFNLSNDVGANRINAHVPWSDGLVYWDFGNISGGVGRLTYSPPTSLVGQWHHWAMVSSVSDSFMKIYLDGIQVATKTGASSFSRGARDLALGGDFNFLDGSLSDVRVWNVARTASEISSNFNTPLSDSVVASTPSLVAYWKFDELSGTTAFDQTGRSGDGVLGGGVADNTPTRIAAPNPGASSVVARNSLTATDLNSLITVDTNNRIIHSLSGLDHATNLLTLDVSSTGTGLLTTSDLAVLGPSLPTTGTFSGEELGTRRLQNLDLTNNPGITDITSLDGLTTLQSLRLEGTGVSGTGASTLTTLGKLTNLTTLIAPTTVLPRGTNLVVNEGSTVNVGASLASLDFDGTNDFVDLAPATLLNNLTSNLTVTAWIKPDSLVGRRRIISSDSNSSGWTFGINGVGLNFQTLSKGDYDKPLPASGIAVGQWAHVAMTFSTTSVEFFVNGVSVGAANLDGLSGAAIPGTGGFRIGSHNSSDYPDEFFDGRMNDVGVWSGLLTASQIQSVMRTDLAGAGSNPVGFWKLNEGTGTTVTSTGPNTINGTLGASTASPTWGSDVTVSPAGLFTTTSSFGKTAVENGVATVTVHGGSFPLVIRNVAPTVTQTPNLNLANSGGGVREGQTISVLPSATPGRIDLKVNGTLVDQLIIADPGTQDLATLNVNTSIENPDGTTTELSQKALAFSDTSSIALPNEVLDGLSNFTTTFWMKTTKTGPQIIVSAANETHDEEFAIFLLNNTTMVVAVHDEQVTWTIPSVSDGVYRHFAVVRLADTRSAVLFINGDSQGSRLLKGSPRPLTVAEGGLFIGQDQDVVGGGFDPTQAFVGSLSDLAVFRAPLPTSEILRVRQNQFTSSYIRYTLRMRLMLNEGDGSVAHDHGPIGFDGRIVGADWSQAAPTVFGGSTQMLDEGNYTLRFTATDGDGGVVSTQRAFTVVNVAPTIPSLNANPATASIGTLLRFTSNDTTDAGANDTIARRWDVTTNNGQVIEPSSDINFSFTPQFAGTYAVRLTATDNDGGESTRTETFTVNPIARITGTPTSNVVAGSAVSLSGTTSSVIGSPGAFINGTPVTREYLWTSDAGVAIFDGTTATPILVPTTAGAHTVTLRVSDVIGGVRFENTVTSSSFNVTAAANIAVLHNVEAGPVVPNGGFESPAYAANEFKYYFGMSDAERAAAVWVGTSFAAIGRNISGFQNGGVLAAEGQQLGILQETTGQSPSQLSQTMSGFTPGSSYAISLQAMPRQSFDFGTDLEVVLDVGLPTEQKVLEIDQVIGTQFATFVSNPFTATKSSYSVTLRTTRNGGTLTGERTNFVDDVRTQQLTQEGTTLLLTASGISPLATLDVAGTPAATRTFAWTARNGANAVVATGSQGTFVFRPADDGTYSVTLTVTDDFGGGKTIVRTTPAQTIRVGNALTTLDAIADLPIAADGNVTLAGHFTDAGLSDAFTATINWGDGQSTGPTVVTSAAVAAGRAGNFSFNHTYASNGNFPITVTLNDGDNTVTRTLTARDVIAATADIVDVTPDPRNSAVGVVTVNFTEDVTGVDLTDFTLLRDGAPVSLSTIAVTQVNAKQYTINLSSVTVASGNYTLRVNAVDSGIADVAGNALLLDATDIWASDFDAPTATISGVSPTIRSTAVEVVTIDFNENVSGVGIDNFTLTHDGNAVSLSGLSVTQNTPSQYTLNLSSVTATSGSYRLAMTNSSGSIVDTVGNALRTPTTGVVLSTPTTITVGSALGKMATGDFNEDGHLDIVESNEGSPGAPIRVAILLGNGNGTFRPVSYLTPSGLNNSAQVADFNNDGHDDVVVGNFFTPDVSVFLGHGDGTFDAARNSATTAGTGNQAVADLTIADFNNDENLDLIVGKFNGTSASILLGNGDGTFAAPVALTTGSTQGFYRFSSGDFDRDGNADLVAATGGASVRVLFGNGDGTFDAPLSVTTTSSAMVVAADVNRDNKLDLILRNGVVLGNGDGSFGAPKPFVGGGGFVTLGNLNGDSHLDIAVGESPSTINVLLGNGDGTFAARQRIANGGAGTNGLAVGDWNEDGLDDYAVGFFALGTANIFLTIPQPEPIEQLWVMDTIAPTANIVDVTPDPRNSTVGEVTIQFSEEVTVVDLDDFTLTRTVGAETTTIGLGYLPLMQVSASQYTLDLTAVTNVSGLYTLTLNAVESDITDVAGNSFTANATEFWITDSDLATATIAEVTPRLRNTAVGIVTIDFNEDVTGLDPFDFSLTRDGLTLDLTDATVTQVTPRQFTLNLANVEQLDGRYELTLNLSGSGILDGFGNESFGSVSDDWIVDSTVPDAVISDVVIGPFDHDAGIVTITFNEPVSGVDIADFSLTMGGNAVSLDGLTVVEVNEMEYRVDLSSLTAAFGSYVLTLNSNESEITDLAGNPLEASVTEDWIKEFIEVTADAHGPYSIDAGRDLVLFGSISHTIEGQSFEWDFNNDGTADFVSETGESVAPWRNVADAGLGAGEHTITLRVLFDGNVIDTATASLTISDTFFHDMLGDADLVLKQAGNELELRNRDDQTLVSHAKLAGLTSIRVLGNSFDNALLVDLSAGNLIPANGLSFDGAAFASGIRGDVLRIVGVTTDSVEHQLVNDGSGTMVFDGRSIHYAGTASVVDELATSTRLFTFGGEADVLTFGNDSQAANNLSRLTNITGEVAVDFQSPSTSLTINAGDGNDAFALSAIDLLFAASLTFNGGSGDDGVTGGAWFGKAVTLLGGSGSDTLIGGAGNDSINGGLDNDTVDGGLGNDAVSGGDGVDLVRATGNSNFTLTDSSLIGQGTDSLFALETALLNGGDGANMLDVTGFTGQATINGGAGNDQLVVSRFDSVFAIGGTGQDTLKVGGPALDLTTVSNDRLIGIDRISLFGNGPQTLTLNLLEVLNLFGETNSLIVDRDAEDNVNPGGGWISSGRDTIGGLPFEVLTQDTTTLFVQFHNHAPTITVIANQTTNEDTAITNLPFIVGDFETTTANLRITTSSSNAAIVPAPTVGGSGANRSLTISPAANQFGTATITVTVEDEDGASASRQFTVTVNPVNDAPTISAVGDQTFNAGTPIIFTIGDVETAAGALTVTATSATQTIVANSGLALGGTGAGRSLQITPVVGAFGTSQITINVSDGSTTASRQFVLSVLADLTFNIRSTAAITATTTINTTLTIDASNRLIVRYVNGASTITDTQQIAANLIRSLTFNGTAAKDNVNLSPLTPAKFTRLTRVTVHGNDNNDTVTGSVFADSLAGGLGLDSFVGGDGNATLVGGEGNDFLDGGLGNESIIGDAGLDTLLGGTGTNSLDGGADDDQLRATGDVNFTLTNTSLDGTGTNAISNIELAMLSAGTGTINNLMDASGFSGRATLLGLAGNDTLIGGSNSDSLDAGAGNDSLTGGLGADTFNGGAGTDQVSETGVSATTASSTTINSSLGLDSLVSATVESLKMIGTSDADTLAIAATSGFAGTVQFDGLGGNDTLTAGAGAATLTGGDGDDTLRGGGAADKLFGGAGLDSLYGAAGNDTLQGGTGDDTLNGNSGTDLVDELGEGRVTIGLNTDTRQLVSANLGTDQWLAMEQLKLTGGNGNDFFDARRSSLPATLIGNDGNDTLLGGAFIDSVVGGNGDDYVSGGAGIDKIDGGVGSDAHYEQADTNFTITGSKISSSATGTTETPTGIERIVILGGVGNNNINASAATVSVVLIGGRGNDTLLGGSANDTLSGGNRSDTGVDDGIDSLNGNGGADTYEFDSRDIRVTQPADLVIDNIFSLLPDWIDIVE